MIRIVGLGLIVLALAGAAAAQPAAAPAPASPVKRTVLDRADVKAGQEAIQGIVDIAVGGDTGRHVHHGLEIGVVLEGSMDLTVQGEPMRTLRAGDSFFVHDGVPHLAKSLGPAPLKLAVTWVVDKDKPLSQPAP